MEGLLYLYVVLSIGGTLIAVWLHTKSGENGFLNCNYEEA